MTPHVAVSVHIDQEGALTFRYLTTIHANADVLIQPGVPEDKHSIPPPASVSALNLSLNAHLTRYLTMSHASVRVLIDQTGAPTIKYLIMKPVNAAAPAYTNVLEDKVSTQAPANASVPHPDQSVLLTRFLMMSHASVPVQIDPADAHTLRCLITKLVSAVALP